MNKNLIHQFIDDEWDKWIAKTADAPDKISMPKPTADTPEPLMGPPPTVQTKEVSPDRLVVRTKTTLDKVYLIDKIKGTRQWVTTPKVLEDLGFTLNDVKEMPDNEFLKYAQGPAVYNVEVPSAASTTQTA